MVISFINNKMHSFMSMVQCIQLNNSHHNHLIKEFLHGPSQWASCSQEKPPPYLYCHKLVSLFLGIYINDVRQCTLFCVSSFTEHINEMHSSCYIFQEIIPLFHWIHENVSVLLLMLICIISNTFLCMCFNAHLFFFHFSWRNT